MDGNQLSVPDQKTLVLVNTFIIHTVQLLNRFSNTCEEKLAEVSRRAQRIDVRLRLLEAQLRSIDNGPSSHSQQPSQSSPNVPGHQHVSISDVPPPNSGRETTAESESSRIPLDTGNVDVSPSSDLSSSSTLRGNSSATALEEKGEASRTVEEPPESSSTPSVKHDPALARFFRMLQVGVPEQAVKLRMSQEGLDPSLLDAP